MCISMPMHVLVVVPSRGLEIFRSSQIASVWIILVKKQYYILSFVIMLINDYVEF